MTNNEPQTPDYESRWWHPLAVMAILIVALGLMTKLYHHSMPVTVPAPTATSTAAQAQFSGSVRSAKSTSNQSNETRAE